ACTSAASFVGRVRLSALLRVLIGGPFIPLAWAVSSKWRGARRSQCGLPRSDDDAVVAHEPRGAARSAAPLVLPQPICGAAARGRLARHEALFVADRGAGGEECDRSGRTRRRARTARRCRG